MQGDSLVGIDQISDEAAAFGVRVNAVAPGPVETAMLDRFTGSADRKSGLLAGITLRRASKPEEVADTILFVASDKASFITGQIININGGKTASRRQDCSRHWRLSRKRRGRSRRPRYL